MPKLGTNVMFWFSFPRFTPRETEDERELERNCRRQMRSLRRQGMYAHAVHVV